MKRTLETSIDRAGASMRRPRGATRIAPAIAGLFLLAACLLVGARDPRSPARPRGGVSVREAVDAARADTRAAEAVSIEALRHLSVPGRVLRYDYSQELEYRFETPPLITSDDCAPPVERTNTVCLSGVLVRSDMVSQRAGVLLFGLRIEEFVYRADGLTLDAHAVVAAREEMALDVLVEMTPRGTLGRLHFPPRLSPYARNLWRALIAAVQVAFPETDCAEWLEREEDSTGTYPAAYRRRFASGPDGRLLADLDKRLGDYLVVRGLVGTDPTTLTQVHVSLAGGGAALFDVKAGFVRSVGLSATASSAPYAISKGVQARSELSLLLTGEERSPDPGCLDPQAVSRLLARLVPAGLSASEDLAQVQAEDDRRRRETLTKGETVSGLLQLLATFASQGRMGSREAFDAGRKLEALFALDDARVAEALSLLRLGGWPGAVSGFLTGALGSAGTPAAQDALVAVLEESCFDESTKDSALVALTSPTTPTRRAELAVRCLSEGDLSVRRPSTATLVLGSMGHNLSKTDPLRARDIVGSLAERAAATRDLGGTLVLINALGNAGGAEAYPVVRRHLEDRCAAVRTAAVIALRRVPGPDAEADVVDRLAKDPDPSVRSAAVQVLRDRPPTERGERALRSTLAEDPDAEVRDQARAALQ